MCTFSEALIEKGELRGETKGTIKGILQGKADSVIQLVKNHIASNIEQAMDMLSVDEKMRSDIERILENRENGFIDHRKLVHLCLKARHLDLSCLAFCL